MSRAAVFVLCLSLLTSCSGVVVSTAWSHNPPLFSLEGDLEQMPMDNCCSDLKVGSYRLKRGITYASSSVGGIKTSRNVSLSTSSVKGTEGFEAEQFEFTTSRGVFQGRCSLTVNGVRVRALSMAFNDPREASLRCDCRDPSGTMSFLAIDRKDGHRPPGTLQTPAGQFKLAVVTKATGYAVVPVGYRVEGEKTLGAIQVSSMTMDRYLWLARDLEPITRDHMACVLSGAAVFHEANK